MDDIEISDEDKEKIEDMVQQFRHKIMNLYKLAYLQGQIDRGAEVRKMLA